MRCKLCDYCDGEAGSIYSFSVIEPKGSKKRKRYVFYDSKTKTEICTYCFEGSNKEQAS